MSLEEGTDFINDSLCAAFLIFLLTHALGAQSGLAADEDIAYKRIHDLKNGLHYIGFVSLCLYMHLRLTGFYIQVDQTRAVDVLETHGDL